MGIQKVGRMPSSSELRHSFPMPDKLLPIKQRQQIRDIITNKDPRKLLIMGPCSVDFPDSVLKYAQNLAQIAEEVKDTIMIVMRFYTGKPRTTVGRNGIVSSKPGEEISISKGIESVRKLAIEIIANTGLPLADEMLDPNMLPYVIDYLTYHAVGARSTEDTFHRKVASGLDVPVGFKNPTSGDIKTMVNSVIASQASGQHFVLNGHEYKTSGNLLSHGILRGGSSGANYSEEHIRKAVELMKKGGIPNPKLIIDASHDNSLVLDFDGNPTKDPLIQRDVVSEVMATLSSNEELNKAVMGFMIESYLFTGRQNYYEDVVHGLSITDPCIGWEKSEKLALSIADALRRQKNKP